MKETWKDIPGYEGLYQVSDLGRIKSLPKKTIDKRRFLKERVLSNSINGRGRECVTLRLNGERKTYGVHQLVAMAFMGHKPCGYNMVVDHIDNNHLNNRLDNLQLITQRENSSKDKVGYTSKYTGVHWFKLTKKWRASIRIDGKRKDLGFFNDEYDAHLAYQNELAKISA